MLAGIKSALRLRHGVELRVWVLDKTSVSDVECRDCIWGGIDICLESALGQGCAARQLRFDSREGSDDATGS